MISIGNRVIGRAAPVLTIVLTIVQAGPLHAQSNAEQRLQTLHSHLVRTVDEAQRICVASASRSERLSLSALIQKLAFWKQSPTIDIRIDRSNYFGAARDLPADLQRVENVAIRKCMEDKIRPVLAAYTGALNAYANPNAANLVSVRFAYARQPATGAPRYGENLLISTFRGAPLIKKNLASNDDAAEGRYYEQEFLGDRNEGILVPRLINSEVVTGAPPPQTRFCIEKVVPPPRGVPPYDRLICTEGAACLAHPQSAGNTRICSITAQARQPGFLLAAAGDSDVGRHWEVPSIDTLTERGGVAGGYTLFNIDTDAFRGSGAAAAEFALTVNGITVWEDGLEPAYQPIPLDSDGRFRHDFALQQLNFRGAYSGCERIEVGLRPIFADGRRGDPIKARLRYVLLRDARPETVALGDHQLVWRATTIRPAVADRNFIIVHSYAYPPANEARRAAAAAAAEADRLWVDGLKLRLNGDGPEIIAAVRPPSQLDPRGLAAYGLILGVTLPSGQVRLAWSPAQARELARYTMANLPNTPRSRNIFGATPYAKAAAPGTFNLPGVCPIDDQPSPRRIASAGADIRPSLRH